MKLCKDCKHCDYGYLSTCDLVPLNGATGQPRHYCGVERSLPWIVAVFMGMCGQTGRYFVKKSM